MPFEEQFKRVPVLLAVIHVDSLDQAQRNCRIAREKGCDGAFLINHGLPYGDLLAIHHQIFNDFPGWWIGVNCLDLAPWDVFRLVSTEVAGIWVDNAFVDEREEEQEMAGRIAEAREKSGWPGLYFGGVAFKYQRRVDQLDRAATIASRYMDVVTTSGPGTGQAAGLDKIESIKSALGPFPLAIASGITPENADQYLPFVDCLLVATGISRSWTELDPGRVEALVRLVQAAGRDKSVSLLKDNGR